MNGLSYSMEKRRFPSCMIAVKIEDPDDTGAGGRGAGAVREGIAASSSSEAARQRGDFGQRSEGARQGADFGRRSEGPRQGADFGPEGAYSLGPTAESQIPRGGWSVGSALSRALGIG